MTEQEWRECRAPLLMLQVLMNRVSDRKLRLFACACARRVLPLLAGDLHSVGAEVIGVGEELADGRVEPATASLVRAKFKEIPGDFQWAAVAVSTVLALPDDFGEETAMPVAGHVTLYSTNAIALPSSLSADGIQNSEHCDLLRDIFGNPFQHVSLDPALRTHKVVNLAQEIYDGMAFERVPVLAEALEEAGCDDAEILAHCRGSGPHVKGCWVVDGLLRKK
jgi:hypothetical protein